MVLILLVELSKKQKRNNMARISVYPLNEDPALDDLLLGTDKNGGKATENFKISDVASIINEFGVQDISFIFNIDANAAAEGAGFLYFSTGYGNSTPWSDITTIRVRTLMPNGYSAVDYLNFIFSGNPAGGVSANQQIIFKDNNRLDSFGIFGFTSFTLVSPNVYDIGLSFISGTGVIQKYHSYTIDSYVAAKEFTFTQPTPSVEWTIQHNMDKFPSVSVVNNNNVLMYGQTTYIDKNNLTINFSAGFSGKAYLN